MEKEDNVVENADSVDDEIEIEIDEEKEEKETSEKIDGELHVQRTKYMVYIAYM